MTPFETINRITSPYGYREYVNKGKTIKENHKGQDSVPTKFPGEVVPESAWNVREVTGGTVKETLLGYNGGRGNLVKVETAPGVIEIYQHLKSIAVKKGQTVKQGDMIGVAGSSGNVTGRHLHFEVQVNGVAVEPSEWSGVPNADGTYPGNNDLDAGGTLNESTEDKQYTATPLVDGLRLRPYPEASDDNSNEALTFLTKGKAYPLVQTRDKWAYVLTSDAAGGWACIEDASGTYLKIAEV